MHNWGIPLILLGIVLLLVMGQWLATRRARSVEGQPAPAALLAACSESCLVFFESPGCPACRQMRPLLDAIEAESSVRICRVDIREQTELASQLRIMGTPTLMLVSGGKVRAVKLGAVSGKALRDLADKLPAETSVVE